MPKNLADNIYEKLRLEIINAGTPTNHFYTESEIAADFKVSRSTAREALHQMCFYGYMTSYPRKGYLINHFRQSDLKSIQRLRFATEGLAVKLIIKNASGAEIDSFSPLLEADPHRYGRSDLAAVNNTFDSTLTTSNVQFHTHLGELSGDENLKNIIKANTITATRAAQDHVEGYINLPDHSEYSHHALVEAIRKRDEEKAITILMNHLGVDENGL